MSFVVLLLSAVHMYVSVLFAVFTAPLSSEHSISIQFECPTCVWVIFRQMAKSQ